MKIVADNKIPFLKGVFEPFADILYFPGNKITQDIIKNVDLLIVRTRTKCNKELLEGSAVKLITTATIGTDHIDTDYCKSAGIEWINAPGCNSGSVMQYVASVLVQLSNKYKFKFTDNTIGIVGVGNVGSKVAQLASILGMKVLLNDPPRERKEGKGAFVSIDIIKKEADIISFHVPLQKRGEDKTWHLFDEDFLKSLKKKPIIINTSRGEVLDEAILKKGLKEGIVKAAALDVWENEPNLDIELLKMSEIATPHIAGYSIDGKVNGTTMVVKAISDFYNLNLDHWIPTSIPTIDNRFEILCRNKTTEEIIKEAILNTYNVFNDDVSLRQFPEKFEFLRGNYPTRREFHYFSPSLNGGNENVQHILKLLGFKIEEE